MAEKTQHESNPVKRGFITIFKEIMSGGVKLIKQAMEVKNYQQKKDRQPGNLFD